MTHAPVPANVWQELKRHFGIVGSSLRLTELFERDATRFERMSVTIDGLLFDYSKNLLSDETLQLLLQLARAARVEETRDKMFSGEMLNISENRAVLHPLLRAPETGHPFPEVHATLSRMARFSHQIRDGEITDIVNIGIGGSSLGPELVTEAFSDWHHPRLNAHFVSNLDASDLALTLRKLSPEKTLFIISSKTFTTAETLQNARNARDWFIGKTGQSDIRRHFVATSMNLKAVTDFGISPENTFPFWNWVGGRYSVWSSVGLPAMITAGPGAFYEFLAGAHDADVHFRTAPLEKNIPVLMGLIGLWYRNFFSFPAYAVIPYHSSLKRFPAWLQQLDMESNGKSVLTGGERIHVPTGPAVFGEPGTNAQHSFFQWLHQSPSVVPVDFIAFCKNKHALPAQQNMLLANCLAQSEALLQGQKNSNEPHRHFDGNRPSTTFLLETLSPYTLGLLMALYEHKIFVQGTLWGINSFDQWGVELGKKMAKTIEAELKMGAPAPHHDGSTIGLMRRLLEKR